MKKFAFTLAAFAALCVGTLYAAHLGDEIGVDRSVRSADHAASLGLVPSFKIKFDWRGRGFLCLKKGNTCGGEIEIGLGVVGAPIDVPEGASVGVILSIDGAPVPEMAGVTFGSGEIAPADMRPVDGSPLPTTSIAFPEQEVVYSYDAGGYLFYYYES